MTKTAELFVKIMRQLIAYDAENKPGAWMKRWGSRYNNFKDLKSDDLKSIRNDEIWVKGNNHD